MSNLTPAERHAPPRPLFETVPAAVEAALAWENFDHSKLNLNLWARSFRCTAEQIAAEFDRQKRTRLPEEAAAQAIFAIPSIDEVEGK